jgi:hypothetical protein
MTQQDYANYDVHPEELLNVFRGSDDDWLGTQEVADNVENGRKRVKEQLLELKGEGRVVHREMGIGHVWKLAADEVDTPIDPELAGVARRAGQIGNIGQAVRRTGLYFFAAGGGLALFALTASIQNISTPILSPSGWLVWAYGTLAGGGAAMVTGAVLILLSMAAPGAAKQVLARTNL